MLANQNQNTHLIHIGIVGSGPAGLMTALSLEHYLPAGRASVTLLDQNDDASDYPGVEYGIQERACRALEKIGLLEQALIRGNPINEITFYNARLDKKFSSIHPDPHYTRAVARQEFLSDMTDLLQQTKVLRRHKVKNIVCADDLRVSVAGDIGHNETAFDIRFDIVVAADGIRSVARRTFFAEHAEIHDRGFSCIYMLIEATPDNAPAGFLDRANSGRSSLVMGDFSTMTMFPLGKGRLALGIGFDHATKAQIWAEHGLTQDTAWPDIAPSMKKDIAVMLTRDARIEDGLLVKAMELVTDWDSYKIYLWAMRDTDPLEQPFAKDANLVAIGDAAHAMLPSIGMGASLAIEDGEILAKLISAAIADSSDAASFRSAVQQRVFHPLAKDRYPVWDDLMGRARKAAIWNFIDVEDRSRFAIGPQIPNKTASRIVSAIETVANAVGL